MDRPKTTGASVARWMAVAVLLCGCYHTFIEVGDDDADASAEADGGVEADAVDEVDDGTPDDVAADEASVEADGATCPGWYDPPSGLCWQDPPDDGLRSWDDAITYCATLVLEELGDWHLPTISELRSLIRGCPNTVIGGPCHIPDDCLAGTDCSGACVPCSERGGPGDHGCYWEGVLSGTCSWYWTSSHPGSRPHAWLVDFRSGELAHVDFSYPSLYVRCVRPGP